MRPYATISPLFWTGSTGKRLRLNPDVQRVAFYLITSPHSHQSGMYYLPIMYLCHEVGISIDGASKALGWLSSEGFCVYHEDSEWIWVREMAAWQIGSNLSVSDKRCRGVQQYLGALPNLPFAADFVRRYASDYHLGGPCKASGSPSEDPPSDQDQDQDQEQNRNRTEHQQRCAPDDAGSDDETSSSRTAIKSQRGTRITLPFPITDAMLEWAAKSFPNVDVKAVTAEFEDYWRAVPGAKGVKLDWVATWRNRVREVAGRTRGRNGSAASPQGLTKFDRVTAHLEKEDQGFG